MKPRAEQSGPMLDKEFWPAHYRGSPSCLDCDAYFYGCQMIDGERNHPRKDEHYNRCQELYRNRHKGPH